jgi:exopolysaccharide biosynthesis polyprenyl glycosylphosphotransferase
MIKEQNLIFKRVELLCDLFLVALSFVIGYILRDRITEIALVKGLKKYLLDENLRSINYYAFYIGLLPVLLGIWGVLLTYFGMYKKAAILKVSEALLIVVKTAIVGFVIFGSYIFVLRLQEDISRLFIGFVFLAACVLISIEKVALIYIFNRLRRMDRNFKSALIVFRRVLIIGTNRRAKQFINLVNKHPEWGIRIVGLIDMDPHKKGQTINGYKVIGSFDDIPATINNDVIDEVVFIVPRSWLNKIEDVVLYCESAGLKVNIAVNLFELKFSRAKQTDLQGFPLLTFESTTDKLGHLFIKRLIDFSISCIGLVILLPFFIIIGILIKVTSEGPVFHKQERCTLYGRKFVLYKFRTMVADAENKLKELLKFNEMDGPVFKMTNDPRITKVGKWLRKYSIDELPQLWNVLKGDMSLVGPRPPIPHEVEKYDIWQRRRLSMRPGITCLWQISGRNEIADFNEWMRLDLEYIDNWSLSLDFKILIKTIPAVLIGIGAK